MHVDVVVRVLYSKTACPLAFGLQVDVVIQGHEHAYARTCPAYQSACTADALPFSTTIEGTSVLPPPSRVPCPAAVTGSLLRSGRRNGGPQAARVYEAPAGGPVYMLAGHAGAGVSASL
jgi:hypothetical protein